MSSLIRIRSERDQMSAIERRIADFILDNAHLLRDYSSQQLASAIGISQSSVVKFSQKLGFKGYPDLKLSVGEAIARGSNEALPNLSTESPATLVLASRLWQSKQNAEEETRLLNSDHLLEQLIAKLHQADRVFCFGQGLEALLARDFSFRLALNGSAALFESDSTMMTAQLAGACDQDVLVLFSETGMQPELLQFARQMHQRGGRVVSLTRHTTNPLRLLADHALVVSAHNESAVVEALLYRTALQHLLDIVLLELLSLRVEY